MDQVLIFCDEVGFMMVSNVVTLRAAKDLYSNSARFFGRNERSLRMTE